MKRDLLQETANPFLRDKNFTYNCNCNGTLVTQPLLTGTLAMQRHLEGANYALPTATSNGCFMPPFPEASPVFSGEQQLLRALSGDDWQSCRDWKRSPTQAATFATTDY